MIDPLFSPGLTQDSFYLKFIFPSDLFDLKHPGPRETDSLKHTQLNVTYLIRALLLSEHDLPERSLAEHLDEVEVVQ